jgi:hypothetical protein
VSSPHPMSLPFFNVSESSENLMVTLMAQIIAAMKYNMYGVNGLIELRDSLPATIAATTVIMIMCE